MPQVSDDSWPWNNMGLKCEGPLNKQFFFSIKHCNTSWASQGALVVKEPTCRWQEMWVLSLDRENRLEEDMTTHSSVLTWTVPWTEEPGGLQSIGLQRVGHGWGDLACSQSTIQSAVGWLNLWCRTEDMEDAQYRGSTTNHIRIFKFRARVPNPHGIQGSTVLFL